MSDFSYALGAGLLGGISGYAQGNIDDKNEANKESFQRERDDAATRRQIEVAKATDQIKADREALIKAEQAKNIQNAYRSSTSVLPDEQQTQQTQMTKDQGGSDMMPSEDDYALKRSNIDARSMLNNSLASGNAEGITAASALLKQEQDAKNDAAKNNYYNAHGDALKENARTRGLLGAAKINSPGGGLAQEKFNRTLSKDEQAAFDKNVTESTGFLENPAMYKEDMKGERQLTAAASQSLKVLLNPNQDNPLKPEQAAEVLNNWKVSTQKGPDGNTYSGYVNPNADANGQHDFIKIARINNAKSEYVAAKPADKQIAKNDSIAAVAEDRNHDSTADKWAQNVMPRFNVAQPDGSLGSGAASFFKNIGIAVDVNDSGSVFDAIKEIDSYIPRLQGKRLEQAISIRKQLMNIK